ncbi:MAG: hypothetical protein GY810_32325 [Aureispira sp.]|nr:hypothetical protein [Aureispira sp.]
MSILRALERSGIVYFKCAPYNRIKLTGEDAYISSSYYLDEAGIKQLAQEMLDLVRDDENETV